MINKTRLVGFLLIGILWMGALFPSGCRNSTGGPSSIKLVPSTSIVVLQTKWREVSKDEYLKRMIKGDQIEGTLQSLGIDTGSIDELTIFGDAKGSNGGSSGMILRCSTKWQTLIARITSQGWAEQTFKQRKIYHNHSDDKWLAPLKSGLLVIGTEAGVEDTLSVELDPRTGLSADESAYKLTSQFGRKQHSVSMFLILPQVVQDMANAALQVSSFVLDFAGVRPLGELLNRIGFARGVGCSMFRVGGSYSVDLLIIMKDEDAAGFVSGALNLLKQASSAVYKSDLSRAGTERFRSYQSLSVSRNHETVSIKMNIPESDLIR